MPSGFKSVICIGNDDCGGCKWWWREWSLGKDVVEGENGSGFLFFIFYYI